jgi:hypothetical protein
MTRFTAALTAVTFLLSLAAENLLFVGSDAVEATTAVVPIPDAAGQVPVATAPAAVHVSTTPHITVVGADANERLLLDEALARFLDNGLELPDLDVQFLEENDCGRHLGLFQQGFTPWRILVCSDLGFVPTHELAHAWEAANLDDVARARYVEQRGLTDWSDKDIPRDARGEEDAAFVIQQNLMSPNPQLASRTWQERLAAYELLTGQPSPLQPTPEPQSDHTGGIGS